ncbi:P-loop containing nucleoside triphosphate hydrolase [Pseudocohnilembus persalinus]|uniref:p-loop containing nucleoside triphosphate hydrolase n=1 Tax=Pseudocohnilembus persalinus TaxID=266149 RepID=A0A0V0QP19_PSEPJ|nr:P-loop containing nucleoside triphosphate hydrolase [Pseudocohnilembus persalinus]|eukprot:KRX04022.1 P-loop containing nucleoside triphosphate hydrolase [Pseudocohnilembus persalinus]
MSQYDTIKTPLINQNAKQKQGQVGKPFYDSPSLANIFFIWKGQKSEIEIEDMHLLRNLEDPIINYKKFNLFWGCDLDEIKKKGKPNKNKRTEYESFGSFTKEKSNLNLTETDKLSFKSLIKSKLTNQTKQTLGSNSGQQNFNGLNIKKQGELNGRTIRFNTTDIQQDLQPDFYSFHGQQNNIDKEKSENKIKNTLNSKIIIQQKIKNEVLNKNVINIQNKNFSYYNIKTIQKYSQKNDSGFSQKSSTDSFYNQDQQVDENQNNQQENGSGKTTLIKSILGELQQLDQDQSNYNSLSSDELLIKNDNFFLGNNLVSYFSQDIWITNGTIKQNIIGQGINDQELFYDADRYYWSVKASGLENDLQNFTDGDLTILEEQGFYQMEIIQVMGKNVKQ